MIYFITNIFTIYNITFITNIFTINFKIYIIYFITNIFTIYNIQYNYINLYYVLNIVFTCPKIFLSESVYVLLRQNPELGVIR